MDDRGTGPWPRDIGASVPALALDEYSLLPNLPLNWRHHPILMHWQMQSGKFSHCLEHRTGSLEHNDDHDAGAASLYHCFVVPINLQQFKFRMLSLLFANAWMEHKHGIHSLQRPVEHLQLCRCLPDLPGSDHALRLRAKLQPCKWKLLGLLLDAVQHEQSYDEAGIREPRFLICKLLQ